MKTIAISIDESSLAAVDRLAGRPGKGRKTPNRSEVIRQAVREFLARRARLDREAEDRRVLAAHRAKLEREATVLLAEQAEP
jgi:metal-responsive CopG/Arc/MetJ family transcriptional regulator